MSPTATTDNPAPVSARPQSPGHARNIVSNWATYLISGAISFFLSPFIVRHLGNSAYGVWVLLVSLTGYLGFLDLGIRGAVTRYIAKFHSQGEHEESSRTISSACGLFSSAGLLSLVAAFLFAVIVVPHFKLPPGYYRTAQFVVLIAGANVALSLISGVFGGLLVGLQRFELHNSIALSVMCLRAVATVLALLHGYGLVSLALIQLGSTVVELILGIFLSRRLYPEVQIAFDKFDRAHVALIFSFGVFAFLLQISNYLIYYTDALVIGTFLPVGMITFFAIAGNLTIYARELVGGFSRTMTPLASKLEAETGHNSLQETTLRSARYCTLLMLPIFVTFMLRGHLFIALWMGPSYADLSGRVLWILSLPWFVGASASVSASVILGIGRHKKVVPVALAEGFGNLILSIILAKPLGVIGVAWGTTIPNIAVSLLFWPWYIRKVLGIPLRQYVWSNWIVPVAAVLPFAGCTYLASRFWPAHNLFGFFVQVACLLPAALLGIWLLGLSREERKAYGRQIAGSMSKVTPGAFAGSA
jgi:O-antigen/teichoic acid export membrane protein